MFNVNKFNGEMDFWDRLFCCCKYCDIIIFGISNDFFGFYGWMVVVDFFWIFKDFKIFFNFYYNLFEFIDDIFIFKRIW